MRRAIRLATAGLVVLLVPALDARPANRGSVIAADLRSGEQVRWLSTDLRTLEDSLRESGTGPVEAAEIAQIVHSEGRRHDVDPLYVLALMKVESGFRADATSRRGAVGLLQVRPIASRSVARADGSVGSAQRATRLRDPRTNVAVGLRYLRSLERQFADPVHVLAAYNMGPTRVRRQLADKKRVPGDYAKRVLGAYRALRAERSAVAG
jgi:soluble lytic murein transglycosylase-like protein